MTPRAQAAWDVVAGVVDPEIPVLTIADLGVLRGVTETEAGVEVTITPTYSGCPAMAVITQEIERALAGAGIAGQVRLVLDPAWTTAWMSACGRTKLRAYGIAPPGKLCGPRAVFADQVVACPRCGSDKTEEFARFGSTACKSMHRCRSCREPFDHFRCH